MSAFRGSARGGAKGGFGRSPFSKQRGLFVNGVWQCDCTPRLPALHLQTKKPGANKGRWFYTCQKQRDDADCCRFFLWDSDAKPREESALLNNSRTEPRSGVDVTPSKPPRIANPPPPYSATVEPPRVTGKRTRQLSKDDEDEFGLNQDDTAFDNELLDTVAMVETPRKATKTQPFMTPRRKLPWDTLLDGMPTPQTVGRTPSETLQDRLRAEGSVQTPSKKRQDDDSQTLSPSSPPFTTPTPSRFKDAGTPHAEDNLVDDVFSLLSEEKIHLPSKAATALRALLGKHARRAEGNSRSKEVLRLRIKAEEAKNMELSLRNNTLQAELEAAKATVEHLKWEMENGVD